MKRSLHHDVYIEIGRLSNSHDSRDFQEAKKKMKPSSSNSDIAAMTLLSLALTSTKGLPVGDFQKQRLPNLQISSSQRRSSLPVLIPCEDEVDNLFDVPRQDKKMNDPKNMINCTVPKTSTESGNGILLSGDWRNVFKPLPLPPRLPKLPAGAKARSCVVKQADLAQ